VQLGARSGRQECIGRRTSYDDVCAEDVERGHCLKALTWEPVGCARVGCDKGERDLGSDHALDNDLEPRQAKRTHTCVDAHKRPGLVVTALLSDAS